MQAAQPNLVLIITDDQGYGDLGCHGNPVLRTPHLDRLAQQSVWLKYFYVSPVCSPTRASLLTGLYSYRTGVVDTYLGRSLMRPQVRTLAEHLAQRGYRTGLFGKWHLGDNYPLRPEDRGFHETLWHLGGGLAQPSDPPYVESQRAYFDPILQRNGQEVQGRGYCTDLFTRAAIQFIQRHKDRPFFAYVAYNAPHAPFQVPSQWVTFYRQQDLTPRAFPKIGQPWWNGKKLDTGAIAAAYGMLENLDANIGRLLQTLQEQGLAERTIVVFLTDNGPGGVRWNGGLRDRKGTVYEGGIRVPCYVCWPGRLPGGRVLDMPLAHIDLVPTLCELCGVPWQGRCDGRSFAPWLFGRQKPWPARTLFFQWHRGDAPEKYRAFAARGPRYKLVQAAGTAPGTSWIPRYELFDLDTDPYEEHDLAEKMPEVVEQLRRQYEAWFADVTREGFEPPRIVLGSPQAPVVRLSRQDWRGPQAGWSGKSLGHWAVRIARPGRYRVTIYAAEPIWQWELLCEQAQPLCQDGCGDGQHTLLIDSLPLQAGEARWEVRLNDPPIGPTHVIVEYLGPFDRP
jgi:arylsulfatase A-like enzyme